MKPLVWLLLVILMQSACKKDGGYYSSSGKDPVFNGTTYDYLKSKVGVYDSFLVAVDREGLKATLMDSSVTVFAVTNPSFQLALRNLNTLRQQSDKGPLYLANIDGVQLDTMISYYIIKGQLPSDSLAYQDGLNLRSVKFDYPMHATVNRSSASGYVAGGPQVIQFSNTKRSIFNRNWSNAYTTSTNIKTKNGVVHVLSPDHLFGFDEFVTRLTYVPPPPNLMRTIGGTLSVLIDNAGGPNNGEGSKKVIDGDDHTKFLAELRGHNWLQFELNRPAACDVYTITSANDAPDRDLKAWTFLGSNDGTTWVELDRRSNFFFEERYQQKVFRFNNTDAYKYYRLDITENRGSGVIQLSEWTINSDVK